MLILGLVLQVCSHSLSTALCLWPAQLQDVEPVHRPQDALCKPRLQVGSMRRLQISSQAPHQVLHMPVTGWIC